MKISVFPIGNSKAIRIPKAVLGQCRIKNSVDLEVEGETIIVRPSKEEPRKGWENAFKKMAEHRDDQILMDDNLDPALGHEIKKSRPCCVISPDEMNMFQRS